LTLLGCVCWTWNIVQALSPIVRKHVSHVDIGRWQSTNFDLTPINHFCNSRIPTLLHLTAEGGGDAGGTTATSNSKNLNNNNKNRRKKRYYGNNKKKNKEGENVIPTSAAALESNAAASSNSKTNRQEKGAARGGFGAKPKLATNSNRRNKKKKKSSLDELELVPPQQEEEPTTVQEPVLDKWGLPPPTLEDIFPPMPEGTEIIPCDDNVEYTRHDIEHALQVANVIPLRLQTHFDLHGHERRSMDGAQQSNPRAAASSANSIRNMYRDSMEIKMMHQSPPVLVIENFLTPQECQEIEAVAMAAENGHDGGSGAVQVESATFAMSQSTRTSTSWFAHFYQVPQLVAKIHYLLGIPLEHMEEPQIVRYKTGQEFSWHYDEVPAAQLANGGQRVATILVYLNTVEEGGGTVFRDLRAPTKSEFAAPAAGCDDFEEECTFDNVITGPRASSTGSSTNNDQDQDFLTVQPKQGRACIFFPALADGKPDDRTLHKGEVVAENQEKRIVQMWIHENPYAPVLPPGNSQMAARELVGEMGHELGFV